jgi:organic hydroperoxide reductase OsmC/OhrA
VTRRDEDQRYAFVDIECRLDVELEHTRPPDDLADLVAKAERDCFVSASLTSRPRFGWTVNGRAVATRTAAP